MAVAKDVDEYIASVPAEHRETVEKLRKLIAAAVPEADPGGILFACINE